MDNEVLRFPGAGRPVSMSAADATAFEIVRAWGSTTRPVDEVSYFGPGSPIDGVTSIQGQWIVWSRHRDGRQLVFADPFGLQSLYIAPVWTREGSTLLVAAKASDAARAMKALGGKVESDWAAVLPGLGEEYSFFHTAYDVNTPVRRVTLVRADQAVLVSAAGYELVRRPQGCPAGATYGQLLARGVDRAHRELSRIAKGQERIILNLSGGKDSRLVLALALTAGLRDKIEVSTTDPLKFRSNAYKHNVFGSDLRIASRMVSRYRLNWAARPSSRDIWPESLYGQLYRFQRYREGLSFQFNPSGMAFNFREHPVRLYGMGGETFRAFWSPSLSTRAFWSRLLKSKDGLYGDAVKLMHGTRGRLELPHEIAARSQNRFGVTMNEIEDGGIERALVRHYFHFRNRGHAGGLRWMQSFGTSTYFPLMQLEFVQASLVISEADLIAGRVGYDLLEQLMPELNDLEYESGAWDIPKNRPPVLDWDAYPVNLAEYPGDQRALGRPTDPMTRPAPDMGAAIQGALRDLQQATIEDGLPYATIQPLLDQPPTDRAAQGRLLSRLATWTHCLDDPGGTLGGSRHPQSARIITVASFLDGNDGNDHTQ